jgi:RNA polymerase sigma-32 factor
MNRRLSSRDVSLNAPLSQDGDSIEFQDTLVDARPLPECVVAENEEKGQHHSQLEEALSALPDRERHIFEQRRLSEEPPTLEELGQRYGVSRERIRQLEVRAFERVKAAMLANAQMLENNSPVMWA